ncbi:Rsd/AlgQ family anti-sigma factor [Methylomonas sp. MED-D]|uniref:Rsd/AlgQ family anti-sigma factor n=1 Tax=unclassified Methylomonas TaxID=2608980 RepID=UPI000AB1F4D8|nr:MULTISPECIES: Rsd/AlgQ family anti-sigma factor [unclassified Methylomonas]MDT4332780.1 Rsd/AlgQ family anti-sigma factor [Methylomonas sp. MV1]
MIASHSSVTETTSTHLHWVEALREERSALWSLYCQIAEMKPFSDAGQVRPMLSQFSQLLIDYVSLGHFGIYEHVLSDAEGASELLSYAGKIYPVYSNTTESAVTFSERYDDGRRNFKTDDLASDLSKLGEHLAERMELEDRLCSMLLH